MEENMTYQDMLLVPEKSCPWCDDFSCMIFQKMSRLAAFLCQENFLAHG